jgi:bifunctional DNase/RNase
MAALMVPVQVRGLTLSDQGFLIMLGVEGEERVLPIFIGAPEAQAIAVALNHVEVPRPLTHDLFKTVMETQACALERIEICDLRENTFYGRLILHSPAKEEVSVDCRPSDAIALALRFNAPILVDEKVMESAAVIVENKEAAPSDRPASKSGPMPEGLTTKEMLEHKLAEAVRLEQYEEAARLRDELRKLSAEN